MYLLLLLPGRGGENFQGRQKLFFKNSFIFAQLFEGYNSNLDLFVICYRRVERAVNCPKHHGRQGFIYDNSEYLPFAAVALYTEENVIRFYG